MFNENFILPGILIGFVILFFFLWMKCQLRVDDLTLKNCELKIQQFSKATIGFWRESKTNPPDMCLPVIGYHPEWVDEDFNPKGVRECFRYGDGTDWHTAKWVDGPDVYITTDEVPLLWTAYPNLMRETIKND